MRNWAEYYSLRSRRKKYDLLMTRFRPSAETSILDVGIGTQIHEAENTLDQWYPWPERIVAVGLDDLRPLRVHYPRVTMLQASGLALPFPDKCFDIVHANAVIEHIIGERARRVFVSETLRVGHNVFITTPNKMCLIEVHTRLPVVHWLPAAMTNAILRKTRREWALRGTYFEPLSAKDLLALFPRGADCEVIGVHAFLPVAETLVAIGAASLA